MSKDTPSLVRWGSGPFRAPSRSLMESSESPLCRFDGAFRPSVRTFTDQTDWLRGGPPQFCTMLIPCFGAIHLGARKVRFEHTIDASDAGKLECVPVDDWIQKMVVNEAFHALTSLWDFLLGSTSPEHKATVAPTSFDCRRSGWLIRPSSSPAYLFAITMFWGDLREWDATGIRLFLLRPSIRLNFLNRINLATVINRNCFELSWGHNIVFYIFLVMALLLITTPY